MATRDYTGDGAEITPHARTLTGREHVANRLGKRKDLWGGEDWVASPQQLMGPEFREDCVVFQDGLTIRARMYDPYDANQDLIDWVAERKHEFGDGVIRAPRPPSTPVIEPEPEDEEPEAEAPVTASLEDADLQGDAEYQAELAALQARMRARKGGTPEAAKNAEEGYAKPPERPSGSSEPPRRPPTPPSFDE